MNPHYKGLRFGAFLLSNAIAALAFFLAIYAVFRLEDMASGEIPFYDFNETLADAFKAHWHTMIVWIAIVLMVMLWRRRVLLNTREREQLLESILNTAADGIYMTDRDGRVTYANRATEEMLGLTPNEIARRKYNDDSLKITTLDGKPYPEQDQPFVRIMQTGQGVLGIEQIIHRVDGKKVIVSINAAPLRNEYGEIIGEVGAMANITERERVEAERLKFALGIERMEEAVFITNTDGTITYVNPAFEKIYGYTRDEAIGKTPRILKSGVLGRVVYEYFWQTLLNKEIVAGEIVNKHKSGQLISIEGSANPIVNERGDLIGFLAIQRDITERKRAEEQLRATEERYKNIVENANDIIYRTDANGHFVFYNPTATRLLKYSADELIGRHYLDLIHPSQRKETRRFYRDQLARGIPSTYHEVNVIAKDGTEFWLGQNVQLLTEEGRVIGFQAVARDITERKRAEATLRTSETRYRSLFENMLDGFAYCKMLFEDSQPEDFVYLSVNKAFEELTGLIDVVGKKVTEVIPGIRESDRELFEIYGRVAMTGKPEKFEIYVQALSMWFSISVYSPEKEYFVAVFDVITERKRAQQALQESEDRYRDLYDNAPVAYYSIKAEDGRIRIANKRMAEMLGYAEDNLIDRPIFDLYADTPDGKEKAKRVFERFRSGAEIRGEEMQMLTSNGEPLWVSISAQAVRNAEGQVVHSRSMAQDISQRKKAEEETMRRNRELAALNQISQALNRLVNPSEILESIYTSIGTVLDDRNLYIALYNEADQQISFPIYSIDGERRTPTSRPARNGITEHILRTKQALWIPSRMDATLKALGIELIGQPAWCFLGVPMLVGDKAIGVIALQDYEKETVYDASHLELLSTFAAQAAIVIDNTRLLDALQQSEAKYRNIFENAVVGMYQTTIEGKYLMTNSALARMLGYASPIELMEEMFDLNRQFYVDSNRRAEFLRQMEERDVVWGFESEVYRRDGSVIWISENARSVYDADGKRIGFEGTTIDITERKQVDRLKSEFVSVVSHELRTPLTSIRGSLGLIAGGVAGDVSPNAKSLVDIAYKNSERLVLLINDILDIEKIESGRMVFDNHPIELMPLLEQAIEANCGYASQYDIELSLTKSLPGAKVNADQGRLSQVLTNLISNAAKFSPRDGIVEIAATRRKSYVRVTVSDHGAGIPEEFHSRIFQKFAQADSSDKRQRGGTGLGLSICKAIVEKLGGRIGFETQPNVGTTFFFDLPEWRDETASPESPTRMRLLVCEDDRDTATLLQILLEQAGYTSDIAFDAAQAKEFLKKNHYAGITLDLVLPDQDGISLIRELREQKETRDLPIIVVSVQAEQGRTALNGDAVQVIDWISKPIDPRRLIGAVRCAVAHVSRQAHILHIDDDVGVLQIASVMLQHVAQVDHATSLEEARRRLRQEHYDLAILDLEMPDGSGLDLVPLLQEQSPPVPIVVFSVDEINRETAAKVSAVLVKSRTSNEKLVETIRSLVQARQTVTA